ncbi:MAG: GLPGLI family protein [Muribaculaceae bacterium]|nr:GLPGLI family protein [Muribaculaceae bacterium]
MRHLIVTILIFAGLIANAVNPDNKYIKEPEEAILEVVYSRKAITDTTMRDNRYFLDDVILRIGKNKSMFCGEKKIWEDSLLKVDNSAYHAIWKSTYEKDRRAAGFLGGYYAGYVYKDFTINHYTEYDLFDMENWKYVEDLKTPEWTITDSVKNIIGYECFKATTDFKGRQWTAWFTPEIPISDGPWKLHGLPGLILEAYDKSHDYEFEAKGIRSSGLGLVGYMEYWDDDEIVSRDEFFKRWWKAKHENTGAKVRAIMGIKSNKPVSFKRIPKYDREEIDYDHSLE